MASTKKIPDNYFVELTLSKEEAVYLYSLMAFHISGAGKNRNISTSIYNAINKLGIEGKMLKTEQCGCVNLTD